MVTEQISHYRIEEIIGSGGMARVYKAFDDRVRRFVAVKMLGEHFTNQDYLFERFEQEARLIASLEHHAIVPVYDYGNHEGRPYIIMRLMTGGSLADRLEQGPVPLKTISHILNRVCAALDKAHANDVIHRDIKPGNILFDEDEIAFLADFGIARFSEMTQSGVVVGSPHYMSPEQAKGKPIDGRSDVYQLGVLLFEMLTGYLPFDGESIDSVIYQHVHEPVPRLTNYPPDLGAKLQKLVNHALAKNRDERIGSAMELANQFAKLVPGDEPEPRRLGLGRRGRRSTSGTLVDVNTDTVLDYPIGRPQSRILRLFVWLVGIAALLTGLYFIPAVRTNSGVQAVVQTVQSAVQGMPGLAQDIQDRGAIAIFEATGNVTETPLPTLTSVPPTSTPVPLLVLDESEMPTDTPTPEPLPAAEVDTPTPTLVPPTEVPTLEPTPTVGTLEPTSTPDTDVIPPTEVSPDQVISGRELAELTGSTGTLVYSLRRFNENKFNLFIRDVEDNEVQITTGDVNDFGAVWSPDGSILAYFSEQGDREVKLINPNGLSPNPLTLNSFADEYPQFDPNGQFIIFHSNKPVAGGEDFEFSLFVTERGAPNSERRIVRNGRDNFAPSFSPDGKKLAYESAVGGLRQIFVYDIDTEQETQLTSFPNGWARHPVWSPDTENPQIAFFWEREQGSEIFVVNPEGGETIEVTSNLDLPSFHPSWAPNGEYLIFHADMNEENNNRDLWIIKPDGSGLRRITDTPDREIQPSIRPLPPVATESEEGAGAGEGSTDN